MEEGIDVAVSRAVAAALLAHGIGASPAAASSAAAAATSPPRMTVTSRDIPEGLSMDFLSNHGVRLVLLYLTPLVSPLVVNKSPITFCSII